ncbi:MAG: twin-arginine translocation signal domain-containing protein [Pirellulales bacterium]|nr:twin-arginine translocation signal domain-containing protein [Pirellulales bacterium]
MSNQGRCCGGRCHLPQPIELSRREFLARVAAGTAALTMAGQMSWAEEGSQAARLLPPAADASGVYPITPGRVYQGKCLEAVGMPVGGIGTGSVWLDGQGKLGVWQIFNNLSEPRIPDSFFAVRARAAGAKPVTRVLQTEAEGELPAVSSLQYEASHPIARVTFGDAELPVRVQLEAMNPMIPLDTANSSIPGGLFRLTAENPGDTAVDVSFCATLQNAVGSGGANGIQGVKFPGYGGNRNRVVCRNGQTTVAMERSADPVPTGSVKIRKTGGREVEGPEMLWIAGMREFSPELAESISRIANEGGILLADGVGVEFCQVLARLRASGNRLEKVATVFEDFEGKAYEGWEIDGPAFGDGPSRGTEPGQQRVTGFAGRGLVNTFQGGDGPQGTATSRIFTIHRRYLGFLIGGGGHRERTCINLRVDGKVVRTAVGKNRESLEPASWDLADLQGKQAVIEIVDKHSEAWGHVNIDRILFSDIPPEPFLAAGTSVEAAAEALKLSFVSAEPATTPAGQAIRLTEAAPEVLRDVLDDWAVTRHTRLTGFDSQADGYRVLATTATGDPLVIEGPLGKGRVVLALAPGLPWNWGSQLLLASRKTPPAADERIVPGASALGTMALAVLDAPAVALPSWTESRQVLDFLGQSAPVRPPKTEAVSEAGQTINAALAVPFTLQPGQSRSVTFALAWHFPNVQRFQHAGNLYSRRWPDALAVADYLADNLKALWGRTLLYQQTLYQSNLPEEFLDAMATQSVIFRGPTCFWSEDGYFGGFEGSYGCCPLNCTHVWNYAQTHARLFPDVGRNMRISNFVTFLHESGETSHREHGRHGAFIDGHCACIEGAYREHQLSPDRKFLETVWPGVKKSVEWLIGKIDEPEEGVPHGHQPNTYDTSVSGANTFIGSQYLSALAAAERLALAIGDAASAKHWRAIREAGMKTQDQQLYNGEYYIQVPEAQAARDYNTGCHADQLLGQWWAHQLNLGYLYPASRVKSALQAVLKYNFHQQLAGIEQKPRRYVPDDEGGLLMCTWPHGGRPDPFILYADEVWTGIEYSTAGAMIYEGLIEEARQVVRMARSRYDGRRRDGLNSGPGGNPYNELECGKFYARALSSWSLLIASQGQILEGPAGILGFKPQWQPEDHRSFFTAPEGWGLFVQQRSEEAQIERIEVRHGQLRLRQLVFATPNPVTPAVKIAVGGKQISGSLQQADGEVRITLAKETIVPEGSVLEVTLQAVA